MIYIAALYAYIHKYIYIYSISFLLCNIQLSSQKLKGFQVSFNSVDGRRLNDVFQFFAGFQNPWRNGRRPYQLEWPTNRWWNRETESCTCHLRNQFEEHQWSGKCLDLLNKAMVGCLAEAILITLGPSRFTALFRLLPPGKKASHRTKQPPQTKWKVI